MAKHFSLVDELKETTEKQASKGGYANSCQLIWQANSSRCNREKGTIQEILNQYSRWREPHDKSSFEYCEIQKEQLFINLIQCIGVNCLQNS